MKWLETHKHLAITVVCVVAFLFAWWKIVAHLDNTAHDARVLAEEKLKEDKAAQDAADKQAVQDRKAYDLLKTQLDSQNAQLRGQIASLAASLTAQQAKDRTLPMPELGERLSGLVGALPGEVNPLPDGLALNDSAARKTVVMLEEVPVLKSQNADLNGLVTNKDKQISEMEKVGTSLYAQIDACKKTQESQKLACDAEKKEIIAKARKSKLKWFLGGLAAGTAAVARLLI